jgi:predicted ATPase
MRISEIELVNWKNFSQVNFTLEDCTYLIGPNAAGKSNFLDVLRFLRDIAHPEGGGLQRAVSQRGGFQKIRSLAARSNPKIGISLSLLDGEGVKWQYDLELEHETKGLRRVLVSKEMVSKNDKTLLARPDKYDNRDPARRTQTALEDQKTNREFRVIAEFLTEVAYLHVVPQFIQHAQNIGGFRLQFDPYGQGLLERIAKTTQRTRDARLGKIQKCLQACIPQFTELRFAIDETTGRPHLEAKKTNWRPNGDWQNEEQFSDGTLRVIGLMWTLLEGRKLLLLEEPELSLDDQIVAQLPKLIRQLQSSAKQKPQVMLTTHSSILLHKVDGSQVRVLSPSLKGEGTLVRAANPEEIKLFKAGFTPAEVMLPKVHKSVGDIQNAFGF